MMAIKITRLFHYEPFSSICLFSPNYNPFEPFNSYSFILLFTKYFLQMHGLAHVV
jgi:hypothetical protein